MAAAHDSAVSNERTWAYMLSGQLCVVDVLLQPPRPFRKEGVDCGADDDGPRRESSGSSSVMASCESRDKRAVQRRNRVKKYRGTIQF